MLRPYKFQIVATAQEIDDNGDVVGEATITKQGEPFTVFGCDGLAKFAADFPDRLAEAVEATQ